MTPGLHNASRGFLWNGAATAVAAMTQLALLWLAARFTTPDEYGRFAAWLITVNFLNLVVGSGLSSAIVQARVVSDQQLRAAATLQLGLGALVSACLAAAAALDDGTSRAVGLSLSSVAVVTAAGCVPTAELQRRLAFRTLAAAEIFGAATLATVAATGFLMHFGVAALAAAVLCQALAKAVLLFLRANPRVLSRPSLSLAPLAPLLRFGAGQLGFNMLGFLQWRIDQWLIGGLLGASALGIYSFAFNLILVPITRLNGVVQSAIFPTLCRMAPDRDYSMVYVSVLHLLCSLQMPALAFVSVFFAPLAPMLLPDRWLAITSLVPIVCLIGACRIVGNPIGAIVLAQGRADVAFRWNLVGATSQILVVGIVAMMTRSMPLTCLSLLLAFAIQVVVHVPLLVTRYAGVNATQFVATVGPFALSWAALEFVAHIVWGHLPPSGRQLSLVASCGVILFAAPALSRWRLLAAFVARPATTSPATTPTGSN